MATTPGVSLHVYIGGTRKAYTEPAKWIEQVLGEIGVPGREREDRVVFVPKIGWRLLSVRDAGYLAWDAGDDVDHVITVPARSAMATYSDDSPIQTRPNQRWLEELGVAQGSQATKGDTMGRKNADKLGGLGADWTAFPPPSVDEPVPLDRCSVSYDDFDADDRLHFGWGVFGDGSWTRGPMWRGYFPGIAGRTKQDGALYGIGVYGLTLQGDGTALLHERRSDGSWAQRASFSWCESSRVIGNFHRISVESDAVRDEDGRIFGKTIRLAFSSLSGTGSFDVLKDLTINAAEVAGGKNTVLDASFDYAVPNPTPRDASVARTKVRVEARQDCATDFQATSSSFLPDGILYCKTIGLHAVPTSGLVHVQAFGHFPDGTTATLRLYGAKSGTECTVAQTLASTRRKRFVDFNVLPGERDYVLNVEYAASSDRLKTPTVSRVRYLREAGFTPIVEEEVELTTVTTITTTGCGADPSTETMGLVLYDLLGTDNATLRVRAGQRIRLEAHLPNPENPLVPIRSVLFRGRVRQARRHKLSGKRKGGFNQAGAPGSALVRTTIKCDSEWVQLGKRLAPGRLDFAYSGDGSGGQTKPFKITDAIRYLLLAMLPASRIDVPDLDIPLPLDQDAPTFIEKFQPILAVVTTLVRDYLGGYVVMDWNASRTSDPTDEGMLRVLIAPKKPFKPVLEFCREPVATGVSPVHPAAYPSSVENGRTIARTFFRYDTADEWIEPPVANQIVVRGAGVPSSALMLSKGGALQVVLNNWVAAKFAVDKRADGSTPPAQGSSGGPPAPDPSSIDFTDGEVLPLVHTDPMLNTEKAVRWVAQRLFELFCHGYRWAAGEAPVIFLKQTTTLDPLQARPRPLRYADVVRYRNEETGNLDEYVVQETPAILGEGTLGGARFLHGYYTIKSAPTSGTGLAACRAAYGDNGA